MEYPTSSSAWCTIRFLNYIGRLHDSSKTSCLFLSKLFNSTAYTIGLDPAMLVAHPETQTTMLISTFFVSQRTNMETPRTRSNSNNCSKARDGNAYTCSQLIMSPSIFLGTHRLIVNYLEQRGLFLWFEGNSYLKEAENQWSRSVCLQHSHVVRGIWQPSFFAVLDKLILPFPAMPSHGPGAILFITHTVASWVALLSGHELDLVFVCLVEVFKWTSDRSCVLQIFWRIKFLCSDSVMIFYVPSFFALSTTSRNGVLWSRSSVRIF